MSNSSKAPPSKRQMTLERTYSATVEDVWALWTTKEGIESWWGPDGFAVTVRKIDLKPGGELLYAMTAVAPPQIEFMKRAGMPTTTESRITYTEVTAPRRLGYTHLVDFIAGVELYDVAMLVELYPEDDKVRMVMTFDAMHDQTWTERMVAGWENELSKLAKVLGQ